MLHGTDVDAGAGEHTPPCAAGVPIVYVVVTVPGVLHADVLHAPVVGVHVQLTGAAGSCVLLFATIANGSVYDAPLYCTVGLFTDGTEVLVVPIGCMRYQVWCVSKLCRIPTQFGIVQHLAFDADHVIVVSGSRT